eukprot:CAMPEP_0206190694 /NCGR_PEP_ID=MMETSP0166-20121206/4895_1 /ASSEMBLY_ACC=CAM_ASM_000260 /TAXON_ID=95228 /ORGANISM="Vannella robusta, Strain DIVA3 518/3/11/1/6" /LENGTH=376 /DNA_ID=CAMNT_0053606807 /DNA_START=145 /DNA_END=1275 /DNA_ORIENTATION=+
MEACHECFEEYMRLKQRKEKFTLQWKTEVIENELRIKRREEAKRQADLEKAKRDLQEKQLREAHFAFNSILASENIPERVSNILQDDQIYSLSMDKIKLCMDSGEIPIGFLDSPVWSDISQNYSKIVNRMEGKQKIFDSLAQEEEDSIRELDELEERKLELINKVQTIRQKRDSLGREFHIWQKVNSKQPMDVIKTCRDAETILAERMQMQLQNPDNFAAGDGKDNAALSLVFNACGLSQDTISRLQHLDGNQFLQVNISQLCDQQDITQLEDSCYLNYLQELLALKQFPSIKHEEECVVCCCKTPEDLIFLIEEHEQDFDTKFLEENNFNGKLFLGLSKAHIPRIQKATGTLDVQQMISTVSYFRDIHLQELTNH